MCGIAGLIDRNAASQELRQQVDRMNEAIRHRGPDAGGIWLDERAGVCLGHRRLAIIDLSEDGRQPMISRGRRYTIVFNGEVYNFGSLRSELERAGHAFRGHSDTEVMLAAIEEWGLRAAVEKFLGMFAFALWDSRDRQLHLVRDRLGKKPLYYELRNGRLSFASELKALFAGPRDLPPIDRDSLALFLRYNYVPGPRSIFQGVHKLQPACILTVDCSTPELRLGTPFQYWSADEAFRRGKMDPFHGSFEEAVEELHELLKDATRLRMVSDVPLGAFLSGGIDSSTVVALMQDSSSRPIRTFSIGFHEQQYNEAHYATQVARHLGTDHTELYVTPEECLAVIPQLPQLYDEPFGDSSQIPTFLVCKLARQHVTVALSGDGGDEFFCGYNRYLWWRQLWRVLGRVPAGMRMAAARMITAIPVRAWDRVLTPLMPLLPKTLRYPAPGDRLHKVSETFGSPTPEALYKRLQSHWTDPSAVVLGSREPPTIFSEPSGIVDLDRYTEQMMLTDIKTYLPDDILVKTDRASMGVALENRCPLLDHRLLEFSSRLPLDFKLRGGKGKRILREVLYRHVPAELVERPKVGFGVPIDSWLRGPLRDWAEDLISEPRLRHEGFLRPEPIRTTWAEHLAGQRPWHYLIWDVLMFQAWHADFVRGRSAVEHSAPRLATAL